MFELARRIRLGPGLALYREHRAWFVDVSLGGGRMRKSLGTDNLAQAIQAIMDGEPFLWPEGTPIAGMPVVRFRGLKIDGVPVAPTPGGKLIAGLIQKAVADAMAAAIVPSMSDLASAVPIEQARDEYLDHKKGEGVRDGTGWFKNLRRQIDFFLAANPDVKTMADVTPSHLSRYKTYLREKLKVGDWSVAQKVSVLNGWFAWGVEVAHYLRENPSKGLTEKVAPPDVIVYTRDEIERILAAAAKRGPAWEALVAVGTYCGLRREEAVSRLHPEDIDREERVILVRDLPGERTKTRKSRRVPLFDEVLARLDRLGSATEGRVFAALPNLREVSRVVGQICEDAGVTKGQRDGLQYMRHSAASHWLKLRVPVSDAARWLGHRQIQTFEDHYAGRVSGPPLSISWRGRPLGPENLPSI